MGLFTKKIETKQQLETMRSELHTMRQRLDEADAAKEGLAAKLGHLDAENQRLTSHVGSVESEVGSVRSHVAIVASSIDRVQAASTELPAPTGVALADLTAQFDELRAILAAQQLQIADIAVVATDAAERTVEVETATSANDSDELRRQIGQLAERVSNLDARLHQVGLELTNQLTELSGDIDAAAQLPSTTTSAPADTTAIVGEIERLMAERLDPHLVDITDGQLRLANEQARYAIQFREDLAELADRLRRPSAR
jgi:chromosome segregation ATPase